MDSQYFVELDNTQPTKSNQPTHSPLCVCDKCYDFSHHLIVNRTAEQWDSVFRSGYIPPPPTPPVPPKCYFITWTRNTKTPKKEWFQTLVKSLQQSLHNFESASIEHIDSNIHCHSILTSKYNLDKTRYKNFSKNHLMDIRKLKYDNGTKSYIAKENYAFNNLTEFINFYENKIN